MPKHNTALWLAKPGTKFEVGPAPYTSPTPGEVVVRTRAVAVNPIDGLPALAYRVVLPWLNYPAVIGSDVAGEVVEVGTGITRFAVGDRVVGHAASVEKSVNRPAEGAFQHYTVLTQHMVSPIPDDLTFEQVAVLPLALSTASSGLFQQDQLGLALPTAEHTPRGETVLVWGGSTSVGSNAIQLLHNAGYRILTTASPRNHDYVRSLGAEAAVDYHSRTVVKELVALLQHSPLAGTLAIGAGSLGPAIKVATQVSGRRKIASAQPGPATNIRAAAARRRGVTVTVIWGGSLRDNEVGPSIYVDFLPEALATGTYRPAPNATVVGEGLESIPMAVQQLKEGVSATKLVVTI